MTDKMSTEVERPLTNARRSLRVRTSRQGRVLGREFANSTPTVHQSFSENPTIIRQERHGRLSDPSKIIKEE